MISIWLKNMYVLLMTHKIAFIRTTLTGWGSFCLKSRVKTNWGNFRRQERLCSFIFFRSAYAAGWTGGVTLQRSDQIPSSVDWGWKYSKDNRFGVDWCGVHDVNLNEYIFYMYLCTRCKCVKKEVSCLRFCNWVCIASQENIVSLFIHIQRRI